MEAGNEQMMLQLVLLRTAFRESLQGQRRDSQRACQDSQSARCLGTRRGRWLEHPKEDDVLTPERVVYWHPKRMARPSKGIPPKMWFTHLTFHEKSILQITHFIRRRTEMLFTHLKFHEIDTTGSRLRTFIIRRTAKAPLLQYSPVQA